MCKNHAWQDEMQGTGMEFCVLKQKYDHGACEAEPQERKRRQDREQDKNNNGGKMTSKINKLK